MSTTNRPVWEEAFWPRLQGPHASRLAARIKLPNHNDWQPCAVLDIGPGGCGIRLEHSGRELHEGDIVTVELKPSGRDRVLRKMTVRSLTQLDLDKADAADAPKVIGLKVAGEPLPDAALMPEGQLEVELAELELLTEHAQRMWQAEQDNHKWLSLRGRVVVASTSGLLGFVAIGLIVAGADSKLNLLAGVGGAGDLLFWVGIVSAFGIAFGLLVCILSVVLYVWHAEEDSGVLRARSDFGNVGKHHFETQPTLLSVYAPYLFEVVLREDRMRLISRAIKRIGCCSKGYWLGMRWRWRWTVREEARRRHAPPGRLARGVSWVLARRPASWLARGTSWTMARRPARWLAPPARWLGRVLRWGWVRAVYVFWILRQPVFFLVPMLRPSLLARRAMNQVYREYIVSVYERKQRRQEFIYEVEKDRAERLGYPYEHDHIDAMPKLNGHYAEPLTRTSSYYLQFAEAFCHRYLGRQRMAEEGTGRNDFSFFDLDRLSPALSTLRPVGWRVLISTYFSAQQMRSSNWNLWYRVRRSERWFALGLVSVAVFFVVNAVNGIFIQRMASPVAPLRATIQGGTLRIEHDDGTDPPTPGAGDDAGAAGPAAPTRRTIGP